MSDCGTARTDVVQVTGCEPFALAEAPDSTPEDAERFVADYNTRRKLDLLMRTIGRPAPPDPARNAEMQAASGRMAAHFARARVGTADGAELTVDEIGAAVRSLRDPETLTRLWTGWYDAGAHLRPATTRATWSLRTRSAYAWLPGRRGRVRACRDMSAEALIVDAFVMALRSAGTLVVRRPRSSQHTSASSSEGSPHRCARSS